MFDIAKLIGMDESAAETSIREANLTFRIMKQDEENMMGTMDFRDDRVNLEVADGKIVSANIG